MIRALTSIALTLTFLLIPFQFCRAGLEDEIGEALQDHGERVRKAREAYEQQLENSRKIAVGRLESIAISAIRKGDLPVANKAWKQVLVLDSGHRKARAHFKSIGNLDDVLKEVASMTSGPSVAKKPPAQAVAFNGHAYLVSDQPRSHRDAKEEAEKLGGTLVRVENAAEWRFVTKLLSQGEQKYYWIDGNNQAGRKDWRFSNGVKIAYYNWANRQPTNVKGEHHIAMSRSSGHIIDAFGTDEYGWIIEWNSTP